MSPEVNLYFYEVIHSILPLTFRVDRGTFRTSTTRLERLIRDADAFIGVFPIPGDTRAPHDRASLLKLSRYFRLELDMAIRSRKPAAVFYDQRYGNLFRTPPSVIRYQYNAQEVGQPEHLSTPGKLRNQVDVFCRTLTMMLEAEATELESGYERGVVGTLLQDYDDISPRLTTAVNELVSDSTFEPVALEWPPKLDLSSLARLRRCDWVIIDTSHPAGETLLAFLHGQFIPTLRVRRTPSPDSSDPLPSVADDVLFGALEVGYRTDVIPWHTLDDLLIRLAERIEVICREPEWIGNAEQATEYFNSAAKRKEKVFLSYANEDADLGAEFSAELSRNFQDVFDYRKKAAIRAGVPWIDQVYEELSAAAVGVLLISAKYQESRYCMDEARQLFDAYQKDQVVLVPVKLDQTAAPPFLKDLQYERSWQRDPKEIVGDLIRQLRGQ